MGMLEWRAERGVELGANEASGVGCGCMWVHASVSREREWLWVVLGCAPNGDDARMRSE